MTATNSAAAVLPSAPKVPAAYDPDTFRVAAHDRELFNTHLAGFVPPDAFDAHAHWYDMRIFAPGETFDRPTWVGYDRYAASLDAWMGAKLRPRNGLFFPMPTRTLDVTTANAQIIEETRRHPSSRCLLMITPTCDPATIEAQLRDHCVSGFKVYHLFSPGRTDTQNAVPAEFIPEWAWELADRYGLSIMLHMVLPRSLAEPANQSYIREHCRRYPNARLILAHAARGFCGRHTVEGIDSLRGLGNVYFDTSVVCEPEAMEAIISVFGTTRLMFGTDYPLSEMRGRSVNLGDGFHWIYEDSVAPATPPCRTTLVGIESLLAVRRACQAMHLNDTDIERIFRTNALDVLQLRSVPEAGSENGTGQQLYRKAKEVIPGGTQLVSKRPEQYVPDKWPAYFSEARGCEVYDLDGRRYLDFATTGIGSCLLGYAHPAVTSAVMRRVQLGSMSTLNSPEELDLARLLLDMHPWAKKMRIGRAGGEALAIAVRIARAGTRKEVVAFCGYHGWNDWYLAANLAAGDALNGHLLPGLSPAGVPQALRGTAMPFSYNKIDELRAIVRDHGSRLAAVVMEPLRASLPEPGFLNDVRQLCRDAGARLIFDEVTSGFRFCRGGAHLMLGDVAPDMAVFAKSLGSGHPIAAIIGTAEAMDAAQDSFISSTFWTEGVGPTAAVATLREMNRTDVPAHVKRIGTVVRDGLNALAASNGVPLKISGQPAQMYLAFDHPQADALLTLFVARMLSAGFLAGGAFYPTLAHDDDAAQAYLHAAEPVFAELAEAIAAGDVAQRMNGKVRHAGFRRLN